MIYLIRPKFRASDRRCPDGFACEGWRQVRKGGFVRWYGRRYYHDDLKALAGLWVYVTIDDWLAITVKILTDRWDGDTVVVAHMDADYKTCKGIVHEPCMGDSSEELNQK